MFKDLPEGETHAFHIDNCPSCVQVTNHYEDGTCAKCNTKHENPSTNHRRVPREVPSKYK